MVKLKMNMPKNCGECRFSQIRYYADYGDKQPDVPDDYKCALTGEWLYDENDETGNRRKIHQNCPLIAVDDESEELQDCSNCIEHQFGCKGSPIGCKQHVPIEEYDKLSSLIDKYVEEVDTLQTKVCDVPNAIKKDVLALVRKRRNDRKS